MVVSIGHHNSFLTNRTPLRGWSLPSIFCRLPWITKICVPTLGGLKGLCHGKDIIFFWILEKYNPVLAKLSFGHHYIPINYSIGFVQYSSVRVFSFLYICTSYGTKSLHFQMVHWKGFLSPLKSSVYFIFSFQNHAHLWGKQMQNNHK